jgi:hypothetical protein
MPRPAGAERGVGRRGQVSGQCCRSRLIWASGVAHHSRTCPAVTGPRVSWRLARTRADAAHARWIDAVKRSKGWAAD